MAIERLGTAVNAQILMTQLQRAQSTLNRTNLQIATGDVADNYPGYGRKTAALEAARSAAERAEANKSVAQQVSSRLDLQDTQLTQLGSLVDQVRQTVTNVMANNDGSVLMGQLEDLFEQAVTILNAKDGSGYVYGGENDQSPPVVVNSLADLAALPAVSDAFKNGTMERSARIGENRSVKVGVLASDLGTELFTLFRDIKQFEQGANGPFAGTLTAPQEAFLQTGVQDAMAAHTGVLAQAAANGDRYQLVQGAIQDLDAATNVYRGFAADIEDVDMGEAFARLNQAQVALQAALHVSSTIGQLSLLNFMK
jgi:flagellar hook-associated protein 3 FlgL